MTEYTIVIISLVRVTQKSGKCFNWNDSHLRHDLTEILSDYKNINMRENYVQSKMKHNSVESRVLLKSKGKAVPLHAMEALGV
jgi:hypothetical protein